jgi:hypothetical protein
VAVRPIVDPPVRPDDRCVVCGRPRIPERSRRYAGYEADRDAFCSSRCARAYFGCELAPTRTVT